MLFSKKATFRVLFDVSANVCAIEYNLLRNKSVGRLAVKNVRHGYRVSFKEKVLYLRRSRSESEKLPLFNFSVINCLV